MLSVLSTAFEAFSFAPSSDFTFPTMSPLFLLVLFVAASSASASNNLVTLNEENWGLLTQGEWMVEL